VNTGKKKRKQKKKRQREKGGPNQVAATVRKTKLEGKTTKKF